MPFSGVRMDCKGIGVVLRSGNATAFTEHGWYSEERYEADDAVEEGRRKEEGEPGDV